MTKNEALKMAIEAMTLPNNLSFLMAITACKEALEQEERTQRTMHCGTADAFIAMDDDHKRRWFVQSLRESKRRKELEDILEQPAQQPVGWMDSEGRFRLDFRTEIVRNIAAVNKEIALYTHPAPSWQGLSDDEKLAIIRKWKDAHTMREQELIGLGDAFEQALKDKNS